MTKHHAMKKSVLPRLRFWLWVALFGGYSVTAVGVMVHALAGKEHDSLSQVAVTSVDSAAEARIGGAAQLAAVYRAQSGTPRCRRAAPSRSSGPTVPANTSLWSASRRWPGYSCCPTPRCVPARR